MFNTKQLKALRKLRGLTQEEIAEQLCISQSAYARLENGSSKTWGIYLKTLCELFNVSPVVFLNYEFNEDQNLINQNSIEKDIVIKSLKNRIINLESSIAMLNRE